MSPLDALPDRLGIFVLSQLRRALPPPHDVDPETLEARDLVAMAAISRLAPGNTAEALLAVNAIAAQLHSTDCLMAASLHYEDFRKASQCRAQSSMMTRQAATAMKQLRQLQEDRAILEEARRAAAGRAALEQARTEAAVGDTPAPAPEHVRRIPQAEIAERLYRRDREMRENTAKRDFETMVGISAAGRGAQPGSAPFIVPVHPELSPLDGRNVAPLG